MKVTQSAKLICYGNDNSRDLVFLTEDDYVFGQVVCSRGSNVKSTSANEGSRQVLLQV